MAKTCAIQRNEKRRKLVKQKAAKRAKLKATIKDKSLSAEERFMAVLKLNEMPKNSSKIRIRNRCALSGRPRAFYRKLNLSRIALRE